MTIPTPLGAFLLILLFALAGIVQTHVNDAAAQPTTRPLPPVSAGLEATP